MEVEGAVFVAGRHTRGSGFLADCEKYNEATLLGWSVLRVTDRHIKSGLALDWLQRFFEGETRNEATAGRRSAEAGPRTGAD